MRRLAWWVPVLLLLAAAAPAAPATADQVKTAKALFFDGKYAEARQAWETVRAGGGPEARSAPYWIARASEKLGETERALGEYSAYVAAKPADRALLEEARTSRVGLAAKLYKAGNRAHAGVLKEALADPSRTVRYYAALQVAGLDDAMARPAIPVLREIVKTEKDPDLVERAKLALLRVDPAALRDLNTDYTPAPAGSPKPAGARGGWIKVRITERGATTPKVSVTMPFALAELVFKSLPDDALRDMKAKGIDADNFWRKLRGMGPTEVIDIEGDDGERIKIWIE